MIVMISSGVSFYVAFMLFVHTSFDFGGEGLGTNSALQSFIHSNSVSNESGNVGDQDRMVKKEMNIDIDIDTVSYKPAAVEQTIMDNLVNWGWDKASRQVPGCDIWTDNSNGGGIDKLYVPLKSFRSELKEYYKVIEQFQPEVANIKKEIIKASTTTATKKSDEAYIKTKEDICKTLRLHPDGLPGLFPSLSLSHTSTSGYIEPLTTPMRHPDFCFDTSDKAALMDMEYLIHDFEAMCLSLQPTSRMILIDMGASLSYHKETEVKAEVPPIVHLLNLYEKFGFHFDHIYGFEVSFTEPNRIFSELLPKKYMHSYHWINAGVSSEKGNVLNPLDSILREFHKDDFVVIKVDIDTASIEVPLVRQLLEDNAFHGGVVDQLYFEHHVKFKEMAPIWRSAMKGSLKETFDLFYGLRQRGIPAHFWP